MANAGFNNEVGIQKAGNGARLGRRLDDHKRIGHGSRQIVRPAPTVNRAYGFKGPGPPVGTRNAQQLLASDFNNLKQEGQEQKPNLMKFKVFSHQ